MTRLRHLRCRIALIALVLATAARADKWVNWGLSDGLAEPYTRSLARDATNGHIWALHGNIGRISKLDGYTVQHLPAPRVADTGLTITPGGDVWVGASRSLHRLRSGQWQTFTDPGFRKYRAVALGVLSEDLILVCFTNRIALFDVMSKSLTDILLASDAGLGAFRSMKPRNAGGFWVSGGGGVGIIEVDPREARPKWTGIPPPEDGLHGFGKPSEDGDGNLLVSAWTSPSQKGLLLRYSAGTWSVLHRSALSKPAIFAWLGSGNTIWMVEDNDLYRIGKSKPQLVKREGALAGQISDVLSESDGSFWIATSQGIAQCTSTIWKDVATGIDASSAVTDIVEDSKGRIWFLKYRGLGVVRHDYTVAEYSLPAGEVADGTVMQALAVLPDGRIAVRTKSYAIFLFDPVTGRFSRATHATEQVAVLEHRKNALPRVLTRTADGQAYRVDEFDGKAFRTIAELGIKGRAMKALRSTVNGDIWIGSAGSVGVYRGGRYHALEDDPGLSGEVGFTIVELTPGEVLVGGRNRALAYDGRNWRMIPGRFDRVRALSRDRSGTLWVASGRGIDRIRDGALVPNDAGDHLPASAALAIYTDTQGRAWAGSVGGLSVFRRDSDRDPPRTFVSEESNLR